MIDFENYERMTIKNAGKYTQIKSTVSTADCLKRLAEFEKLIEKKLLIPKYSILKDWQYGDWCVCELDDSNLILAQYKTEEEAKQKLKELTESDTE